MAVCLSMGCVGDVEAGKVCDNEFVSEDCVGCKWSGMGRPTPLGCVEHREVDRCSACVWCGVVVGSGTWGWWR